PPGATAMLGMPWKARLVVACSALGGPTYRGAARNGCSAHQLAAVNRNRMASEGGREKLLVFILGIWEMGVAEDETALRRSIRDFRKEKWNAAGVRFAVADEDGAVGANAQRPTPNVQGRNSFSWAL